MVSHKGFFPFKGVKSTIFFEVYIYPPVPELCCLQSDKIIVNTYVSYSYFKCLINWAIKKEQLFRTYLTDKNRPSK